MGTAAVTYISGRLQPGSLSEKWLAERLGRLGARGAVRPGLTCIKAPTRIVRPGGANKAVPDGV